MYRRRLSSEQISNVFLRLDSLSAGSANPLMRSTDLITSIESIEEKVLAASTLKRTAGLPTACWPPSNREPAGVAAPSPTAAPRASPCSMRSALPGHECCGDLDTGLDGNRF